MITLLQAPVQEFKPQFQNVKTMGLIICPELRRKGHYLYLWRKLLWSYREISYCVHTVRCDLYIFGAVAF